MVLPIDLGFAFSNPALSVAFAKLRVHGGNFPRYRISIIIASQYVQLYSNLIWTNNSFNLFQEISVFIFGNSSERFINLFVEIFVIYEHNCL